MLTSKDFIRRSAGRFFSGTMISRVLGLIRDILMAGFFGTTAGIAQFMMAYRFSNLFRRLLGESALGSSFIPHFEKLRLDQEKQGALFFRDLFFSLTGLLLILIISFEIFLFTLAPQLSLVWKSVNYLTMVMLPGLVFICLYALQSAFLQCQKRFFLPAVAPGFFNIIWILSACCAHWQTLMTPIYFLSLGIVGAFFCQWVMTVRPVWQYLKKELSYELWRPKFFSTEVKSILPSFFLTIFGIGAMQINSALDPFFATYAGEEGPAYLWYAIRLQQLPIAVFGLAISSSVLPLLSRSAKSDQRSEFKEILDHGLDQAIVFLGPITFLVIAMSISGTSLIFQRGAFTLASSFATAKCLWAYAVGILPATLVQILASGYYAQSNYKTPTRGAILSVILNIILNSICIFVLGWGPFSVAISTSLCSLANFIYLASTSEMSMQVTFCKQKISLFLRSMLCGALACSLTLLLTQMMMGDPTLDTLLHQTSPKSIPLSLVDKAMLVMVQGISFLGFLLPLAYVLKLEDLLRWIPKKAIPNRE